MPATIARKTRTKGNATSNLGKGTPLTPVRPDRMHTPEVARALGLTPRSVLRLAQNGHLKMYRIGRTTPQFARAQVEELARQMGTL